MLGKLRQLCPNSIIAFVSLIKHLQVSVCSRNIKDPGTCSEGPGVMNGFSSSLWCRIA